MAKTATKKEDRRADRLVTSNRRANYDYFIEDTIEAGIALHGTEIKSLREGKVSIAEAYARIRENELWLIGASISPYEFGSYTNHDPERPRKLLVHKKQIRLLREEIEKKGKTIVPLRIRLKDGKAKVDIGIAKGKKNYDKRQSESDRDARREIDRVLRGR